MTDHFLIRYADLKEGVPLHDGQSVNVNYICSPKEHLIDLSTNLLGHYTEEHIKIMIQKVFSDDFNTYCDPSFPGIAPLYPEQFDFNDQRVYWTVKIEDIVGLEFEFMTGKTKKKIKSYVQHTPTKCNFWHFSIRWEVEGEKIFETADLLTNKSKLSQKIGAASRATFSQLASILLPAYVILDDDLFQH
ncbi:hypothetical protein WG906_09720 [Pedobacter sp. P351]|uniref:hypothetical protein n=1 Tax=Pedobacter superstes TaxID=3133441 RepID=UPI0030B5546D